MVKYKKDRQTIIHNYKDSSFRINKIWRTKSALLAIGLPLKVIKERALLFFVAGNGIWIGGKRDHGVFKWFTSNGKTKDMNYTQWITDLENVVTVYPNYICVTIIFLSQYEWFSYDCDIALNFICKTYM